LLRVGKDHFGLVMVASPMVRLDGLEHFFMGSFSVGEEFFYSIGVEHVLR